MEQESSKNDQIELIIPSCIEKSTKCLQLASNKDVTQLYNIKFKNVCNQQLYVEKESDLRDILRQYCMYKKLCELINNEMCKLDLEFQVTDRCRDTIEKKLNTTQVELFKQNAFDFIQDTVNPYCEADCGKTLFVHPPPVTSPVLIEEKGSSNMNLKETFHGDVIFRGNAMMQIPILDSVTKHEEFVQDPPNKKKSCCIIL